MFYDLDKQPRGVTLIRVPYAGAVVRPAPQLQDIVPFMDQGRADPRTWKPDATTSQTWNWGTDAASAPLADGTMATNHLRLRPRDVTFDAVITDTPLVPFGTSLGGLPTVKRADSILAGLLDFHVQRAFVAVISKRAFYSLAYIESISEPVSAEDGQAYFISIHVVELRTFSLRQISSIDDAAAQFGAAKTVSGGIELAFG